MTQEATILIEQGNRRSSHSVRTLDNHRYHICNKLNQHMTHSLLKFAFDYSEYL